MHSTDERLFGTGQPQGRVVIYCLPDAGGSASAFGLWPRKFPESIEIRPLRLPGRNERINEPPQLSVREIADAIARRANRPYALYGHSLGARLAFETVRELRRRPAAPLPVALFVAAARPPDTPVPLAEAADLPDEQLVEALIQRAGADPELREHPELRDLVLPIVRHDLRWLRSYSYRPEPPLPVPVVAIAGEADLVDGPLTMREWARHAAGPFRMHTVSGGHAFHRAAAADLVNILTTELLAVLDGQPLGERAHR